MVGLLGAQLNCQWACQVLDHLQLVQLQTFGLQDADYFKVENVNLGL